MTHTTHSGTHHQELQTLTYLLKLLFFKDLLLLPKNFSKYFYFSKVWTLNFKDMLEFYASLTLIPVFFNISKVETAKALMVMT